ncbi:MAG: DUF6553 family protein [Saccharofermentanales bacterium]
MDSTQYDLGEDQTVNNNDKEVKQPSDLVGESLRRFRFFPLKHEEREGDRFLLLWLTCQLYSADVRRKGRVRRARLELCRFFEQKELTNALEEAGEYRTELLEEAIFDSANVYLTICRDDDNYGRKFFGVVKMKSQDRENKILSEVYQGMLPLLAAMQDFPMRAVMARAIHTACLNVLPQCVPSIDVLLAKFREGSDRAQQLLGGEVSDASSEK